MALEWFPIALLGVWRITHLLAAEDGPEEAIIRVRTILPGAGRPHSIASAA